MSCDRTRELDLAAFAMERQRPDWAEFRAHYPRCGDCSREVAVWSNLFGMLRADDTNPGGARAEHPDASQLLAFETAPASLAPAQRTSIEAHLVGCGACRSELSVLRGFDFSQLAPPAASRDEARAGSPPSLFDRISAALGSLLGPIPQPALAFGAIALLLLPAGFVLWRVLASDGGSPGQAPQVAQEAPLPASAPMTPAPAPALQLAQEPPAPQRATPLRVAPAPLEESPEPSVVAREITAPEESSLLAPAEPTRVAREVSVPDEPSPVEPAPLVDPPTPTGVGPIQIAALVPAQPLLYDPGLALAFGPASGMRVTTLIRSTGPTLPEAQALAPDHVGLTAEASPELYWRLSAASEVPVEITLTATDAVDPLLEVRLAAPVRAGLQRIALAERGVVLSPGVTYRWYVALVPDEDRRDADLVTGGAIRREPLDPALTADLAQHPIAERAHRLAGAGYWYDAFATLSQWIEAEPDAETLRRHRDSLLAQVAPGSAPERSPR